MKFRYPSQVFFACLAPWREILFSPPLLTFYRSCRILLLMGNTNEIPYGTLDLMVLKTLASLGKLHGYGIARRIEQVAEGSLALNQGTIYPALLRLEQRGWISR